MDVTGTVKKAVLNGVTYRVPFDVNMTVNLSAYENEGLASHGATMIKKTLRMPTIESLVIFANPLEAERLKSLSESIPNFTISIELADGSTYRGNGQINFENWESEEGRATITLIPDKAVGGWVLFSA